jgi:hypothetical protein
MSNNMKTNLNYLELMARIDRIKSSLSFLMEDAKRLGDNFDRLQKTIDHSIKPEK